MFFIPNKTAFTKYCLTQWVSKPLGSFEIHLVRQYIVNSTDLAGIVDATVYKTAPIFTSLVHGKLSYILTMLLDLMILLINAIETGHWYKHHRLCLWRVFVGFASAAWSNVASTAVGATCEKSTWVYPHDCTGAIDGYLIPHLSWIPKSDDPNPWLKVSYFARLQIVFRCIRLIFSIHTLHAGDLVKVN